jgi:hypothetical protein
MDFCAAVALKHMEPDATPLLQFPLNQISRGPGWTQAAGYLAYCTNQAAEGKSRSLKEQHKAEDGAPPTVILPIPELVHHHLRLISSKVSSTCLSLHPTALVAASISVLELPHTAGIIHPEPHTEKYTLQFQCSRHLHLILHAVSC